jgi:hypothetical protein
MHLFATSSAEQFLELGRVAAAVEVGSPRKEAATAASPAREA